MKDLELNLRRPARRRRKNCRLAWLLISVAVPLLLGSLAVLQFFPARPRVEPHALHEIIVDYLREHRNARNQGTPDALVSVGDAETPSEAEQRPRPAGIGGRPRSPLFDPLASDSTMRVEIGSTIIMSKIAVVEVLFFDRAGGMWPRLFVLAPEGSGQGNGRRAWKITGIGKRYDWRDGCGVRGTRI